MAKGTSGSEGSCQTAVPRPPGKRWQGQYFVSRCLHHADSIVRLWRDPPCSGVCGSSESDRPAVQEARPRTGSIGPRSRTSGRFPGFLPDTGRSSAPLLSGGKDTLVFLYDFPWKPAQMCRQLSGRTGFTTQLQTVQFLHNRIKD